MLKLKLLFVALGLGLLAWTPGVSGWAASAPDAASSVASANDVPLAPVATAVSETEAAVETSTAEDPAGVVAVDVSVGSPVQLPAGLGLIIETGCWHCDGSTEALVRVVEGATGLYITKIFEADRHVSENAYITSFALRPDASEMVVAVCTHGYCGGLGFATADAQVTLYRSVDVGSTWQKLGTSSEAQMVMAVTDSGIVVGPGAGPDYKKVWLLGGASVLPPAGASSLTGLSGSNRNGELTWWDENGRVVLGGDGRVVMTLPQTKELAEVALNQGQPPLALWVAPSAPGGPFGGYYLTTPAGVGTQMGLRLGGNWASPAQWLDGLVVATVEMEGKTPEGFTTGLMTPSLVDLRSGVVRPIAGIVGGPIRGRNLVRAVFRADAAGIGCVQVRDRWKITAAVLDCQALAGLRQTGERRYGDAREWRGVVLSDGRSGWAEASALR